MAEIITPELSAKVAVFLEVADQKYDMAEVSEKAKADYKANHKEKLNDIKVYVKPEDGKAYYTANGGKVTGSVAL